MRELHLVHGIKLRSGVVSVFKDPGSASWLRTALGDYELLPTEDPTHVYFVPAAGVKHEKSEKLENDRPVSGTKK